MSTIQDPAGAGVANVVDAVTPGALTGKKAVLVSLTSSSFVVSDPAEGSPGAAVPTSAIQVGGTDGTNLVAVKMKPASTAAIATDPALVVAVSPNNSVAVTQGTAANLRTQVDGQGTAGTPVGGVVSVQGVSGGTPQPVSGSVTANIGTAGTLALDATLTGGTQKAIVRGGAKGATTAADVTSTAQSVDRQALDVQIRTSAGAVVDSFASTQYVDGAAKGAATGTLIMVDDGANVQSASGDANGRLNVNSQGTKTNNSAAPGTNNLGVLPAVANAANPTLTEGNQVGLSTLLTGAVRTDTSSWLGSTAPSVGQKTAANSIPVALASDQPAIPVQGVGLGGWAPSTPNTFFGVARGVKSPLSIGPDGTLQTYSQVLTDAGSFRDDYIAALATNLTGTVTLTNGSTAVTGSGCAFTTELNRFSFIRGTAAAEGTLAAVLSVTDDNTATLATPYTGATATGVAVVSSWDSNTGAGGSVSVANSLLSIASGTTNGSNTWVFRGSDYGPMEKTIRFSVSQRIANQTVRMGFFDNFVTPKYCACIELTGTVNTQVTLVTRSNTGANDVESVTVNLPAGINTGTLITLLLDLHMDRVTLYFDPVDGSERTFLAMCKVHIPPPYVTLLSGHGILNTGVPASTTTCNFDMVLLNDYNVLVTETEDRVAPDSIGAVTANVTAAVADTALLATNLYRATATVFNDSTSVLYLKLGTGASATSFTVRVAAGGYYELPRGTAGGKVYTGAINGFWAAANGAARVTEIA